MANIEQLVIIKAPVSKVYEALTTEKGMKEVWTTELTLGSKPGDNANFKFGKDGWTNFRIEELIPEKKTSWKCYESESDPEWLGTTIEFHLEPKAEKTYVTLKHIDWKEVTDTYRFCNYNWALVLTSLKKYVEEGKGSPYKN